YTYEKKYGIRDFRGGGRSSARETACRVVAGAIAKQLLSKVKINAFTSSVGDIFLDKPYQDLDFSQTEFNIVRCPDKETADKMISKIRISKNKGILLEAPLLVCYKIFPWDLESQFLINSMQN